MRALPIFAGVTVVDLRWEAAAPDEEDCGAHLALQVGKFGHWRYI